MTNTFSNANTTLSIDDLTAVNGGTFTPNKFPEWAYNRAGIMTNYHFWDKDEFYYKGWKYDEEGANRIMKELGWETQEEFKAFNGFAGSNIRVEVKCFRNGVPEYE